jgi:hypothetical protein
MKKILLKILNQAAAEFKKEVAKPADPNSDKSFKRIFDDILQKAIIENIEKLFETGLETIEEALNISLDTAVEISTTIKFCVAAKKAVIAKDLFRVNTGKDVKDWNPALSCIDEAGNALQTYLL